MSSSVGLVTVSPGISPPNSPASSEIVAVGALVSTVRRAPPGGSQPTRAGAVARPPRVSGSPPATMRPAAITAIRSASASASSR